MSDEGTQEAQFDITQEMADAFDNNDEQGIDARVVSDMDYVGRYLKDGWVYELDPEDPNHAWLIHPSANEPERPGNPPPIFPVRVFRGSLAAICHARAEVLRAARENPQPMSPLPSSPLAPFETPRAPRESSPQIDIGKALAEAPGTPLGQGGKRQ